MQDLVRLRLPESANLFPEVSEDGTAFVGFDDAWNVKLVHWEQNDVEVLVLPPQQFRNVDVDGLAVSYVNRDRMRFHVCQFRPESEPLFRSQVSHSGMWRIQLVGCPRVSMSPCEKRPIDSNAAMDFARHTPMSNGCFRGYRSF